MGKIRVIVADGAEGGSAVPTGLLRAVLEREGVEIAGEVGTETELIQLAADEQPDAVIFATRAPQPELDRLRRVAPAAKVVFVSSILVAAEAEMAEAVVERADVLASLGPVLVHLCTPGRANARRAITESFDRPDWIDRVRKDPVTLREILSDQDEELDEHPSVMSLQGRAREAAPDPDDDLIVLADLEAGDVAKADEPAPGVPARQDRVLQTPSARLGRRRRFGLWALALAAAGLAGAAWMPSTIPADLVRATDSSSSAPEVSGANDRADPAVAPTPRLDRDPIGGRTSSTSHDPEGAGAPSGVADHGSGDGTVGHDTGGEDPAGSADLFGASAEHNPHGGPPGQEHGRASGAPAPHSA